MKKSVYSLVLMDDVVDAVDRLACRRHMSRSSLINQILAEHVALSTPEQRMRDVFGILEELMNESFRVQPQQGGSMLSMLSALRFKYKPTIRYSVELYPETMDGIIGQLKVSFRSQNLELIAALNTFFSVMSEIENRKLADRFPSGVRYSIGDGRCSRDIHLPANPDNRSPDTIGTAIGSYIRLLDSLLKQYFENIGNPLLAAKLVETSYCQALNTPECEVLI